MLIFQRGCILGEECEFLAEIEGKIYPTRKPPENTYPFKKKLLITNANYNRFQNIKMYIFVLSNTVYYKDILYALFKL